MSRRVKTPDPSRPNYVGKEICTKEEFVAKFAKSEEFLSLFKNWQDSGFQRREAPSIDRIDNSGGYTLDNMQFIKHVENTNKDVKRRPVIDENGIRYESLHDCSRKLNRSPSTVLEAIQLCTKVAGVKVFYENP